MIKLYKTGGNVHCVWRVGNNFKCKSSSSYKHLWHISLIN